jgi:hypothetical protein
MKSPLSVILTFALTLALSLPGRAYTREDTREEICVNASVEINISVEVDVSVNVTLDDNNVNLAWQTGTEPDLAGFNIHRADTEGPYTQMNDDLIQPQMNNDLKHDRGSGDSYTFVDKPGNGKGYYYMLESVDNNGKRKYRALVYVSNP